MDSPGRRRAPATFWSGGDALGWLGGVVLVVSAFTGWYGVTLEGLPYSVTGWHTGTLGKLVFAVGAGTLMLLLMRATGLEPPVPGGVVLSLLGAAATIFVLIRLVDIPTEIEPAGRGVGLWISLAGAVILLAAGLLRAAEEV